jgi:uncharacterized protein YutE (UPF0331/DUF86 family)
MMRNLDRGEQYEEKFISVVEALESIPDHPELMLQKVDTFEKLYLSIEAIMDVTNMVLEDLGENLGEDFENVSRLEQLGIIDYMLANKLIVCSGLMKLFGHRYDGFDDRLALNSVAEIRETIYWFMDVIDGYLEQYEGENGY